MEFTAQQQQTLQSAVNRIIPPDDYPGAWDNGVGDFIFRILDGPEKHQQTTYCDGLDALYQEGMFQFGAPFANLTPVQQDTILRSLENGVSTAHWTVSPSAFFRMLVHHTAEGYYADPGNGGNQSRQSWDMIGFDTYGAASCTATRS